MAARRVRCAFCNKHFTASSSRAKYCPGDVCRNGARRGTRGQAKGVPPKKRAGKGGLTVVADLPTNADPPADDKPKHLTVSAAAETDDPMQELIALRRVIARDIDASTTKPADRATLTRQLLLIRQQLEALKAAGEEDPLGEAAGTPDEEFDPTAY